MKRGLVGKIKRILALLLQSDSLYWDWWSANENIDRGRIPELFQQLTQEKGKTVLDIGSGNGFYAEILRNNGYKVTCVDRSKKVL